MADYVFYVTVSGGKFVIDSVSQQTVDLGHTITYQFDQSDSTNSGHPLRLSTTSDGTHNSGSEYTTGVTTTGTPGNAGAYTEIAVTSSTPATLYYYCSSHSGMGGQVNTTASEFANTSGVALKKPILANATNKWGNYSNQNLDAIAGKLPQSFVFPTGTGLNNQVILSDGSGGTSWGDVALIPEVTGVTWYSDSSYSSVLSTSEAINIDDATYLKVTGSNLGNSGSFGASAYVQIVNTTQSNAVVGNNQSGLTGCVTASSWQSDSEWRFTINPNNVSGISSGDTLKVKVVTGGGESLFGTGYVVSADPTSVTTVNSATINNTDSVGSFGGAVAGGGQDSNTKLLLNFDRTGGTDVEDSSNTGGDGHKVTASGSAVIKASPFGDGKSAMFFNGNERLTLPTSADWNFSSGDWTIELWAYVDTIASGHKFLSVGTSGSVAHIQMETDSNGDIKFWWNSQYVSGSTATNWNWTHSLIVKSNYSAKTWYHIAIVKNSSGIKSYVNGLNTNTESTNTTIGNPTSNQALYFGSYMGGNNFTGYLDEIRIVKGTAVYTGDFDVPTSRFSASDEANTKLLIHSEKEDDASDSHHTVSLVNSATFSTSDTLSWSGSHYDLTGSKYIKVENPSGETFEIPSSTPFCLEGWFKSNSNQSTHAGVFGLNDDGNASLMLMFSSGNLPRALVNQAGGSPELASIIGSSALSNNTWYHGAIVRQTNNDIKFYIDGAEIGSASNKSGAIKMEAADSYFMSGTRQYTNTSFDGYVQDVRLVIGSQVYSGAFTKPNGPLTTTGGAYSSTTNVDTSITSGHCKLLLSGDQGAFTDSATSGTTHTITPTGAYHSQAHGGIAPAMTWPASLKKTGSAGVYFDGNGDYLTISSGPDFNGGAYTYEWWMYPTANPTNSMLIDTRDGSNPNNMRIWADRSSDGTGMQIIVYSGGATYLQFNSIVIPRNQWTHVALASDGANPGVMRCYINGKYGGKGTKPYWDNSTSVDVKIGKTYTGTAYYYQGYVDGFRIRSGAISTSENTTNWGNGYSEPTQIYGAFKSNSIDTITLTGSAGSGGGYVTFNNATLSGNTETTSNLPAGLSLNETEDANNTATITGDLTEIPGNYSIQLVARVTSDGTDANIDPNRKQNYSHTITKGSGGTPVLFNARRYQATGVYPTSFTGLGFQPDLLWFKSRTIANSHVIFDSVRGVNSGIMPNQVNTADTGATNTQDLSSFDSDGFTLGTVDSFGSVNEIWTGEGAKIVWAWKAGTSFNGTTNGSKAYSGSKNVDAGFSIIKYQGNGTDGHEIPHGLSSAPNWVLVKNLDTTNDWMVFHSSTGTSPSTTHRGILNTNATFTADSGSYWSNDFPTSSVVTLGSQTHVNGNNNNCIMYCWHSVSGVSAFGSYTGGGSSNSTFANCGFFPRFIMTKRTDSTGNWMIMDNIRDTASSDGDSMFKQLYSNTSGTEDATGSYDKYELDEQSGNKGFFAKGDFSTSNASGGTYIFMAFA